MTENVPARPVCIPHFVQSQLAVVLQYSAETEIIGKEEEQEEEKESRKNKNQKKTHLLGPSAPCAVPRCYCRPCWSRPVPLCPVCCCTQWEKISLEKKKSKIIIKTQQSKRSYAVLCSKEPPLLPRPLNLSYPAATWLPALRRPTPITAFLDSQIQH